MLCGYIILHFQNMNYARNTLWMCYYSIFFKIRTTLEILYGYLTITDFQNVNYARNIVWIYYYS